MHYAVNIGDLLSADFVVKMLIQPVLEVGEGTAVNAEPGKFDGMSARFTCDAERAIAIIETIRLKVKRHELRFYESSTGNSWKRI